MLLLVLWAGGGVGHCPEVRFREIGLEMQDGLTSFTKFGFGEVLYIGYTFAGMPGAEVASSSLLSDVAHKSCMRYSTPAIGTDCCL
jgi:hypothetical protein